MDIKKRQYKSTNTNWPDHSPIKRHRPSHLSDSDSDSTNSPTSVQPRVDPTYGQRGAFPGLDNHSKADDLFYAPASDGLEYLRMVRTEAHTIPNLLVAPRQAQLPTPTSETDLYADYDPAPKGYYSNGAYTATPLNPAPSANPPSSKSPQAAYNSALLTRFASFRRTLSHAPNPHAQPPPNTTALALNSASSSEWRHQILHLQPTMLLLSDLSQEAILIGLEALEALLGRESMGGTEGRRIGAWAWGLLGRCRGPEEMVSEEVGVVRGVGKAAVRAWRERLKEQQQQHELEEESERLEMAEEADEAENAAPEKEEEEESDLTRTPPPPLSPLSHARAALLASINPASAAPPPPARLSVELEHDATSERDGETDEGLAMLYVLAVLVAEVWRQKDLLGGLGVWG